jgi:hypothetical protein
MICIGRRHGDENVHGPRIAVMCMYAGTSVDGIKEHKPAAAIVEELMSEL